MLRREHLDRINVAFDDHRLVAIAGLILPVNLAHNLAVADELTATTELVPGKLLGVPVALIKGYPYEPMDEVDSRAIVHE